MHLHHPPNTLFLLFDRVVNPGPRLKLSGVNTEKSKRTDKGISRNFKCQSRKWRFIISRSLHNSLTIIQGAFNGLHLCRRGQELDHSIQYCLYTLILEGRAAHNGDDFVRQSANADALFDLLLCELAFLEVLGHQLFVRFRSCLHHVLSHFGHFVFEVRWDIGVVESHAHIVFVPDDRLLLDQVDHALEVLFRTNRHLNRHRVTAQSIP